jgi:hypothetical protein
MQDKQESMVFALEQVAVRLHPQDNVAIAKIDLPAGATLTLAAGETFPATLSVQQPIPSGHKVALQDVAVGHPCAVGQVISLPTAHPAWRARARPQSGP